MMKTFGYFMFTAGLLFGSWYRMQQDGTPLSGFELAILLMIIGLSAIVFAIDNDGGRYD